MGTIAKSSITLSSISDAYSVSLTPSVCVIHADFDGGNPVLTNAYTLISVYCGEVKVPFTVKSITASHDTIAFRGNKVDDNNYQLLIKGFSNDVLEGYLEIVVDVNGLITLQSRFMFTVERESTMLDWIQDWQNNKTTIGSTSIITPKLFVGKKITGSHNSLSEVEGLTGVYIGPSENDSCGVYGYKDSVEIFHLDETGGKIGGWDINEGGLFSSNGKLRILSNGSISAINDESDAIWQINSDGSASFAMENVRFYANGDAEFKGSITSSDGKIGGWNISQNQLWNDCVVLDSLQRVIGVSQAKLIYNADTGELTTFANIKMGGGVAMYYTSSSNWGLVGYSAGTLANNGKQLFSLGSQNFIAGWNFDDTSLYIGIKNNNAQQYTDASGSLTIGTEGLRGNTWYIDKNGTASFVKGLVSFGQISGIIAGWTIIDNKFAQNHIALTCATGTAGLYMTSSDEGNFIERGPDAMEGFIDSKGGIYMKVKADSADFAAYDTNGSRLFKIKSNGSSYIAGWCFNNTTLYTGTQATSGYTTTGNITIGPTGLRGYKWRFENNGSGAIAGGNIEWDENGNVTFADKVSMQWNQGIQVAQMIAYGQVLYRDPEFTKDKKNGTQIYAYNSFDFCVFSAAQLVIAIHDEGLLLRGTALVKRVDLIHSDGTEETVFTGNTQITPDQSTDLMGVISSISESDKIRISYTGEDAWLQAEAYDDDSQSLGWLNLCGSGEILGEQYINTSRELVQDETAPNSTQKVVKFTNTRWISITDFRLGGFLFGNKSRVNGKFVVKIVANIPVGWKIDNYHNAYGNGGKTEWMTSQLGTGGYTEYVCVITCGSTGSFGIINHFALTRSSKGDIPIAGGEFESGIKYDSMDDQMGHSMPKVEWYVAYATVFDATSSDKLTTTIDAHGIYTGTLRADQIIAGTIDATKISADVILSNGKAWALNKDGSGYLAEGKIRWDKNGNTQLANLRAESCIFKNVKINGTVSQPWAQSGIYITIGNDDEKLTFDNIAAGASGGWQDGSINSMISWTLADSGRIIRIANWRWGSEIFTNTVTVKAPDGKYFFEDGIAKNKIEISREIITLMGYADSTTFYGWAVIGRVNFNTVSSYGRELRALAMGIVTDNNNKPLINYNTFDNSTLSVERLGTGSYKISIPTSWGLKVGSYQVMLTGYGGSLLKANLANPTNSSFEVQISDDASANDGDFQFQIFNMNDWLG